MTEANTIELKADDVVAGRYRICRRLGVGGMGTVYESQQITLDRKIALKVLRPELAGKEMAAKRFEREAKSASSIEHRNVVSILDFGNLETGELYYTMELLQGRDLSKVLKEEGALPWSRAGWIILQVVRAFAAIHDKGIVHRDLKPANCVLLDPKPGDDPDFVKILDFGIANLQDKTQATALTGASDIIGSAPYMAPEQVEGKEVDARTDIYSLGIMMYELLTGKVPFREQHIYKIMMQHLTEAPQPPRELVPEIPPEVEAIILRAVAKKPEDRYQSMAEIELDLSLFVEKPMASAVLQRTSPSGASADRSAMGSSAGRPMLATQPGPTGTVAIGSSAGSSAGSMRATRQEGRAAETSPRVGASFGFNAQTFGEPQRKRGMLLPIVLVLLVFAVAIGLTLWLQRDQGDEIAKTDEEPSKEKEGKEDKEGKGVLVEEEEEEGGQLLPLPEAPYDPFADPFGAPPLGGRTMQRPGTATADGGEVPMEPVDLEKILPPQSWTLEPGSIAGRILGEKDRPLAKAQVCAWIVDPAAPLELRRSPKCTKVNSQGRFELREIKPSLYEISAFARGFSPLSLQARDGYPLAVEPGKRSEGIEMVLVPGGVEIRGTVKTTVGDPIASASVSLVGSVRALTTTNAKGEFSLWGGDAGGTVAVIAFTNGYSDGIAKGPASDPFALVLRRESKLIGVVVDPASGEPIENARVRAGTQGGGIDPLVYTNAKGEFTIGALPEGSYKPTARTDVAFGEAKKVVKLKESAMSPEVRIEARTFVVEPPPKPPEPPAPEPEPVPAGDDATAGADETTGGTEGGGDEGGVPPPEPEPAPGSGKPEEGKSAPPKPVRTDKMIRKEAAMKIKACGTDGKVVVTADFVLDSGKLLNRKVKITGNAGKDPAIKACVENVVKRLKLLPRKDPTSFEELEVTI